MKASPAVSPSTTIFGNITVATRQTDLREIEIKLVMVDAAGARRMLREKGFGVIKPRVFESNSVFDTPNFRLRRSESLLRIRRVKREAKLTYKGPPEESKHKSREELELEVGDAEMLAAIFRRLGFQQVFRYEKYRTEFRRGRTGTVTLDETPIGVFLELEGPPAWIDRTARLLGFGEDDYITASYGRLYLDWCDREGSKPGDMVFEPA
jgi:adenylate cyclase, class 2